MIIKSPHLVTKLTVYSPRYHDNMCLVSKRKIDHADSGVIIIKFTQAPAYQGRYAIYKSKAMRYPTQPNGESEVYLIPVADLDSYITQEEVLEEVEQFWPSR